MTAKLCDTPAGPLSRHRTSQAQQVSDLQLPTYFLSNNVFAFLLRDLHQAIAGAGDWRACTHPTNRAVEAHRHASLPHKPLLRFYTSACQFAGRML